MPTDLESFEGDASRACDLASVRLPIGQGSCMSRVDESASPGSEPRADAGGLRVVRGGRFESREWARAGGTAERRWIYAAAERSLLSLEPAVRSGASLDLF